MKPYYSSSQITIYHGDSREIIPTMNPVDVIITDPVWPDCKKLFPDVDADVIFRAVARYFPNLCRRLIVILGCDINPRFLSAIPESMKFFRACWMRFIPPRKRGTLLAGADVAYVFGSRYRGWRKRVLPGEITAGCHAKSPRIDVFPCSRNYYHMIWLVEEYTRPGAIILDPFCGAGSTLVAAKMMGRGGVGIEINERSCELSAKLLEQTVFSEREFWG